MYNLLLVVLLTIQVSTLIVLYLFLKESRALREGWPMMLGFSIGIVDRVVAMLLLTNAEARTPYDVVHTFVVPFTTGLLVISGLTKLYILVARRKRDLVRFTTAVAPKE